VVGRAGDLIMQGLVLDGVLEIYFRKKEYEKVNKTIENLKEMNYYVIDEREANSDFGSGMVQMLPAQYTTADRMKKDYIKSKEGV